MAIHRNQKLLNELRAEAEKLLKGESDPMGIHLSDKQIKELLHELQIQQIELEMQNDELKTYNDEMELQRIKFANLFDLAPIGYFILNHSGIIEEVNSMGYGLLDADKKIMINRRFQSFITTDDGELFYGFLQRMLISKTRQSCQLTMLTPKGENLYTQIEGTAKSGHSSEKVQYYITVIDITERKNAEIKQREIKERLEMALDASSTGTWEIDVKFKQIKLDDFSCAIFGLSPNDFDGCMETFMKFIHPDDKKKVYDRIRSVFDKHKELDLEYRIIRTDHTMKYIGARGHVVYDDKQASCFVGILTDITEKKQLQIETENLKSNQQKAILLAALQAQENERKRISESLHDSVSQLLYGIKLKLAHHSLPDEYVSLYTNVNQLLDQAIKETRNISFQLAPSIISDFGLGTTIEEMAKRLNTGTLTIKTRTELSGRLEVSKELSIFRIVQELTNNSIKHANATEIRIAIAEKGKVISIHVSDNGIGFSPKDKFRKSVGTGLASIRNRINLFNGNMKIESKTGQGAKVTIKLKDIEIK